MLHKLSGPFSFLEPGIHNSPYIRTGLISCAEDTVGVPPKGWSPASKHVWNPVYDGKLFVVRVEETKESEKAE